MKKIYLFLLVQILLVSCGYGADKITEEKIKKIYDTTELDLYSTSELKEKKIVFSVSNLMDENPENCWATRVNGGVDEEILLFFIPPRAIIREKWQKGIGIINGFAKSKSLYEANSRAKDVEITLYRIIADITVNDKYPREMRAIDIKLIEQTNVMLNDEYSKENKIYFTTNLENDYKKSKTSGILVHYALVLTVKSIYKGSKHNDLCISEIKFLTE